MFALTTFYSIVLEVVASAIREERDKRNTDWKGRNKTIFVR